MNVFEKLYKELKSKYGCPKGQWSLWCKRPKTEREREGVLIGAILTHGRFNKAIGILQI